MTKEDTESLDLDYEIICYFYHSSTTLSLMPEYMYLKWWTSAWKTGHATYFFFIITLLLQIKKINQEISFVKTVYIQIL